jgi:hypothetical protein
VQLAFSPSSTAYGVVNGAWRSRTRDPTAELPALATAVADRLGLVRRITLNADAWTSWPHQLVIISQPEGSAGLVRRRRAHDQADGRRRLAPGATGDPPDTPTILALACLARAAGDMTPPDRAGDPAGMQATTAPDGRHLPGPLAEPAPLRCPTQGGR